jgi:hypothetical protein
MQQICNMNILWVNMDEICNKYAKNVCNKHENTNNMQEYVWTCMKYAIS